MNAQRIMLRVLKREEPTDEALVAELLQGDERAFDGLVRRHAPLIQRVVRRYARNSDEVADLTQRAFVKALLAVRRARGSRRADKLTFRAWLIRIAVNVGKNHARDMARWRKAPLHAIDAAAAVAPTGTDDLLQAERAQRVRAAVLALPPRQREVLTLRIDAELPFAEIAAALDITENNAKVNFHHAARRLKAAFAGTEDEP